MVQDVIIGIDVGGTNTDAVFFTKKEKKVIGSAKSQTTRDVTKGIISAIQKAKPEHFNNSQVKCLSIGTTIFVNAILERDERLAPVAVIRLGKESKSILPFDLFPRSLRKIMFGHKAIINGGFEFNGKEISKFSEEEIIEQCKIIREKGIKNVVVSGVFSPMNNSQELRAKEIILKEIKECSVTMSHEVGQLGFLERENAAILNESLVPIAKDTVRGFQEAFGCEDLNLKNAAFYLTQNDGTLISSKKAMRFPIFCIASGPTNSARGAYYLTGKKNAIFLDIGGTTTDVGIIENGFPRLSQTSVDIGGVRTNFRIPDVKSIALGGGTIISKKDNNTFILGPESVGFELEQKAKIFGGSTLTTTDLAILNNPKLENIGKPEKIKELQKEISNVDKTKIFNIIHQKLEDVIDLVKSDSGKIDCVVVGGGKILIEDDNDVNYIIPKHAEVANAIGAASAQIGAEISTIVSLKKGNNDQKEDEEFREEVLNDLRKKVIEKAIHLGAKKGTVQIVSENEIELGYVGALTGKKKVQMKAVGDINKFQKLEEKIKKVNFNYQRSKEEKTTNKEEDDNEIFRIKEDYKPNIVGDEWILNKLDLKCICLGAGVLGCGGGGSTFIGYEIAKKYIGKMKLISPEKATEDDRILPFAFMGAPSIMKEKIPHGLECASGLEKMGEIIKHKITGCVCAEIGGMNSLTPLIVAAHLNLPAYDCDYMGRAFPELQMFTSFIYSNKYTPCVLTNSTGKTFAITKAQSPKEVENDLRRIVFGEFGGIGGLILPPETKSTITKYAVKNTYSQAWRIGKGILLSRCLNLDPVESIIKETKGKLIYKGKIVGLNSQKINGFDKVKMEIQGVDNFKNKESIRIIVQNENLVIYQGKNKEGKDKIIATVPDLISLINPFDGEPIQTEALQFGLQVSVLVLPASDILKTEKALKVVGPQAFKLNCEYKEIERIGVIKSVFEQFK